MSVELETAERYRSHAEELRIIAETDRHVETRRVLRGIADDYDRMAQTLEEIDRTNNSAGRSGRAGK